MKYILIEEGEDRTAIASNTVVTMKHTDMINSSRYYLSLERDNGETDKFVVDDFEVREMSAVELTSWLKGEDVSDEDEEKVAWQKFEEALNIVNDCRDLGVYLPLPMQMWLANQLNAIWAGRDYAKENREDDE